MNKLRGSIAYGIGPLDRTNLVRAKAWRKDIKEFLNSLDVMFIDPLDKPLNDYREGPDFAEKRAKLLEAGDYEGVAQLMKPIRNIDLRFTDKADFIVCDLDLSAYPCGTYEEIFNSNRAKKPILIHCPQGIKKIPVWLYGTLNWQLFFEDWGVLKRYLQRVNEGLDTRDFGRWSLLEWDKLKEGTTL